MRKQLTLIVFLFSTFIFSQGLTTSGKIIVDENGNEVLLRGYTPGGWLVMEGYMMQSEGTAGAQHEFVEKLLNFLVRRGQISFLKSGEKIILIKRM